MRYLILYFVLIAACLAESTPINSFSGGYYSPLMEARYDFGLRDDGSSKYRSGCRTLENMIPFPQGTANKRPGTKLMAQRPIEGIYEEPYASYKLTYISENGHIYGFPITNTTVSGLDAGVAVINNGDGTVSLPFTGHPFEDGWTVYVTGTAGGVYNGVETVVAGSEGTNYIKITAAYGALTCTGNERVLRYFNLDSGAGECVQDSSGNVYYGSGWTGDSYVTKITTDGTLSYPFTGTGWPIAGVWGTWGIRVSKDNQFLYVMLKYTSNRLYKFNLSTGVEIWSVTGIPSCYDMELDDDGNVYIGSGGDYSPGLWYRYPAKFSAEDGTKTNLTNSRDGVYDTYVDDDMGVVIFGGNSSQYAEGHIWHEYTDDKNIHMVNLDGTNPKSVRLGDMHLVSGDLYATDTIGKGQIWTYDGYIYIVNSATETLYKLDTDLNIKATKTVDYLAGGYYDLWGNLVLVSADWADTIGTVLTWCDPSTLETLATEALSHYSPISPMKTWEASVGGAYQQGDAFFWPGITASDPAIYWPTISDVEDFAIKIIPFEFSTDDSYILEFGENYIGFYRAGEQIEN